MTVKNEVHSNNRSEESPSILPAPPTLTVTVHTTQEDVRRRVAQQYEQLQQDSRIGALETGECNNFSKWSVKSGRERTWMIVAGFKQSDSESLFHMGG